MTVFNISIKITQICVASISLNHVIISSYQTQVFRVYTRKAITMHRVRSVRI